MIDVIDYRAGNSPSVIYALERLGLGCRLVAKPEEIAESERLVLPGVGAAAATLDSLRESDLLDALGRTEYGIEFASVVAHDNVVATQFHAEKSGGLGLRLLADFAVWDGRC